MVESVSEGVLVSDPERARGSVSFGVSKRRSFPVANTRGLALKRGDFVEIVLPTGRTVLQTAITFLLPLILFSVTYGILSIFVTGTGEGVLFLAGFGALLLGFPLGALLCRIVGTRLPTISRVLADENALVPDDCPGCGACADFDCRIRGVNG